MTLQTHGDRTPPPNRPTAVGVHGPDFDALFAYLDSLAPPALSSLVDRLRVNLYLGRWRNRR